MKWFKHNTNAGNDPRLIQLKSKLGYKGTGLYWALVEMIQGRDDGLYPRQDILALGTRETPIRFINEILDDFGLFATDEYGLVSLAPFSAPKKVSKQDLNSDLTNTQLDLNSDLTDTQLGLNSDLTNTDIEPDTVTQKSINQHISKISLARVHVRRIDKNRIDKTTTPTISSSRTEEEEKQQQKEVTVTSTAKNTISISPERQSGNGKCPTIVQKKRFNRLWQRQNAGLQPVARSVCTLRLWAYAVFTGVFVERFKSWCTKIRMLKGEDLNLCFLSSAISAKKSFVSSMAIHSAQQQMSSHIMRRIIESSTSTSRLQLLFQSG